MYFYIITNKYVGNGYIRVYIIAPNDERALELARQKFKENSDSRGKHGYDEDYWTDLRIVLRVQADAEYVSAVDD